MRNVLLFLGFAASLAAMNSAANAGIIGFQGDVTDTSPGFSAQYSAPPALAITGTATNMTPDDLAGTILVDAEGGDPSIDIENIVYNHSGASWNGYLATIEMSQSFDITLPFINQPTDWNYVVTPASFDPDSGDYIGSIQMNGGTPVASVPSGHPLSSQLDFGYTLSFSGSQSPTYTQTLSPVPEPSTLVLLGACAVGVLACGWRRCGTS